MSKTEDIAMTLEEIRSAAAIITDALNWLADQLSKETAEEKSAPPAAKPALTLEQVRAVLAEKSGAGHTAAIRALLRQYGASKLSDVDPKDYEALLLSAQTIGKEVQSNG